MVVTGMPTSFFAHLTTQAVHYNFEAEKAQANPLVAASTGFLYNLCAVLLRLARPIIESPEKLNKVDWSYLNSVDPALSAGHFDKETKLMRSEGDDSLTIPVLPSSKCTGDYNFITQSFFLCWKILHIGVVQECIRYPNVLRALQRMHVIEECIIFVYGVFRMVLQLVSRMPLLIWL